MAGSPEAQATARSYLPRPSRGSCQSSQDRAGHAGPSHCTPLLQLRPTPRQDQPRESLRVMSCQDRRDEPMGAGHTLAFLRPFSWGGFYFYPSIDLKTTGKSPFPKKSFLGKVQKILGSPLTNAGAPHGGPGFAVFRIPSIGLRNTL